MQYFAKHYDVVIIGAGHAGIEAGLASFSVFLAAVHAFLQ